MQPVAGLIQVCGMRHRPSEIGGNRHIKPRLAQLAKDHGAGMKSSALDRVDFPFRARFPLFDESRLWVQTSFFCSQIAVFLAETGLFRRFFLADVVS